MASPHKPRPADIAIAGNRMLTTLLRRIWEMNYKQLAPDNMGASLVLMMVSFCAAIATSDGEPHTITEIAKIVGMPAASVRRYVEILVKYGRVKMVAGRKRGRGQEKLIVANLDVLDAKITLEHTDASITLIMKCVTELVRLRGLLQDQLAANGKRQAGE